FAHEKPEPEPSIDYSSMSPDEQALLERPISDLNLSVRARKCMARLGLNTLGDLIRKSGDDFLECKNFGVTSLNEVREKISQYNLKLRGDCANWFATFRTAACRCALRGSPSNARDAARRGRAARFYAGRDARHHQGPDDRDGAGDR